MSYDQTVNQAANRLNELYWHSGRTIDEIISEAGVARNTLYASIQPLEAGLFCSSCAGPLHFTNRTNRSAGTATCLSCGFESGGISPASEFGESLGREGANGERADSRWSRWREDLRTVSGDRTALIGGAAALGAMLGAAATRALRD